MGPNTDAILYKCIEDRWYTLQGHASDEYDNAHYKRYGLAFHNRDAAVAHARELAKQQDIPESEIFEDLGAGDF
jgi:hypothetical protein